MMRDKLDYQFRNLLIPCFHWQWQRSDLPKAWKTPLFPIKSIQSFSHLITLNFHFISRPPAYHFSFANKKGWFTSFSRFHPFLPAFPGNPLHCYFSSLPSPICIPQKATNLSETFFLFRSTILENEQRRCSVEHYITLQLYNYVYITLLNSIIPPLFVTLTTCSFSSHRLLILIN